MTAIMTNPQERTRFLRFAVVGVVGAVVDFGTFNLLVSLFSVQAVLASVISFLAAVINNFVWNRYWTYPDSRSRPVVKQLAMFSLISLMGLLIRTPLFAFLEVQLTRLFISLDAPSIGFITAEFMGHNLALAIAVVVVMFWNFFVNRYWTYNDVR
jgi:putative flippase GtrA